MEFAIGGNKDEVDGELQQQQGGGGEGVSSRDSGSLISSLLVRADMPTTISTMPTTMTTWTSTDLSLQTKMQTQTNTQPANDLFSLPEHPMEDDAMNSVRLPISAPLPILVPTKRRSDTSERRLSDSSSTTCSGDRSTSNSISNSSCCSSGTALKSRKRRRGTVQFREFPTGYVPRLYQELTLQQVEQLWYQPREIMIFKHETRNLVLYGKQEHQDDLSGLERFNIARSKHKKQTIRRVLLASKPQSQGQVQYQSPSPSPQKQRQENPCSSSSSTSSNGCNDNNSVALSAPCPDFVRTISQECTSISTDMALVQGFHDFCQVYDPLESLLGSNDSINNYNDYFFNHDDDDGDDNNNNNNNNDDKQRHHDDRKEDVGESTVNYFLRSPAAAIRGSL